MCYSSQIAAQYKLYVRYHGAHLSLQDFVDVFWTRRERRTIKIPKAIEAWFDHPTTDEERLIKAQIDQYKTEEAMRLEQLLFTQRKRLADAERKLQTKVTQAATESKRIAANKIIQHMAWLADLRRTEPQERDARIYPATYVPVIVWEDGRRVVKPMRYQCRPAGKPAFYDTKFPGTFNARRDNLEGFWKEQFGFSHGIALWHAFYENVPRHRLEHRALAEGEKEESVVLQFNPNSTDVMLVACLWSRWSAPNGPTEPDLLSFAAITDEPPPEVAAAGHDRCIVPIKKENIDAWLQPDRNNLARQHAILDDRERPYYEHRLVA